MHDLKALDVTGPELPPSAAADLANTERLFDRSLAHRLEQLPLTDWTEYQPSDGRRWTPRSTLLLAGGISLLAWVIGAWAVRAIG